MPYQPGTILLDKYRIEALLGQGAFGEVYRVTHLTLNVPRAIKVLRHDAPGVGSSLYNNAQQRFQLEAQLGAQLNSQSANPHLLLVYDFINTEEQLALEMEYAPGGNLSERIRQAKVSGVSIPVSEALQIAADVAGGLAALHAMDIVHRDLKPANILFDKRGHARLADLGLAQIPGGPSQRSQLSEPNPHPGTPGYMSPEQETTGNYLTPASDVYSLGVTLFELLTGRAYRSLRPGTLASKLRAELPSSVDDLLARMLAEAPKERPWDGEETLELLQAALTKLQSGQAEDQARKKAEAEAAEQARLAIAAEEQRKETQRKAQAEAVEKTRREAEEQARQTAQAKARAEAAERALQSEKEARLASERRARENEYRAPAAKPANSRFSFAWLAALGFIGLAGVVFVFVIVLIYRSMVGGTPASPAPTAENVVVVTEQPNVVTSKDSSTQTREKDGMVMVYVPEGSFTMGSDADAALTECQKFRTDCQRDWFVGEEPIHTVTLDSFWIDQTEVTNGKYAQCVQAGVCTPPSDKSSSTQTSYYGNSQFVDYPVIYVDWNQAKAYCEWAGGRLPTEAEWEKAARGTDGRTYPWGEGLDKTKANYNSDVGDTTRVGSYESGKSPYGAYDMAGNVWEWVADWYGSYATSSASNPTGPASGDGRVLRGGSWVNYVDNVRSANRDWDYPSVSINYVGFRCSRSQ